MRKTCNKILLLLLIPVFGMAQRHYQDSLRVALHKVPNDSMRYLLNMQIAYYYQELDRDSSIRYYDAARFVARKHNKKYAEAGALGIKGSQLALKGRYAESLQNLLSAFNIVDETKSENNSWFFSPSGVKPKNNKLYTLSRLQNSYAVLMRATKNTGQEIFYLKESIKNAKLVNDPYRIAIPEIYLGNKYITLNKLDSALIEENEGLKSLQFSTDKKYVSGALTWIGYIYMKKGNMPLAEKYLYEGIHLSIKSDNLDYLDRGYFILTSYYLTKQDKDSSLVCAKKTLQFLHLLPTGDRDFTIDDVYQNLSRGYRLNNQPDSVIKYQAMALTARDSIYQQRIKDLADFQNLGFRQQLHLRDLEKEKLAYQSRVRVYGLLAGVGVLMLLAAIFYRNNRQKQKANIVLSRQKEEVQSALSQLKATQTQLIQSEKMASLGELTAGIAHEIQNPLNFVNNFSEVSAELVDEMDVELAKGDIAEAQAIGADLKQNLEKIRHHGKRADAIVKGMLQHSQSSSGAKEPTNINALADEYLRLSYHGLRSKDKSFNADMVTHFDEKLPAINVIPQDIGRVFLNLFNNAFYAVNQKQKTAVEGYKPEVSVGTYVENGKVVIKVKDNGVGIPDAIKEKIMQPFFTTKPTGEGTGLGLSLTYDMVVKGHGGSIQVNSVEGEGSEFIIQLPIN